MKRDKKMDQAAMIDMNDFLVSDAKNRLKNKRDLAKTLAHAASSDITGLDELLNDNGAARKDYADVATGYLVDRYQLSGDELASARDDLIKAAVKYLRNHTQDFNQWQR